MLKLTRPIRCLLVLSACIGLILTCQAQKTIKGIIIDVDGVPLPGVTVTLPGSTIGTQTNLSGLFTLTIPAAILADIDTAHIRLKATFTGYADCQLQIGSAASVSAILIAPGGFPFPWPPKTWSAAKTLDRSYFDKCQTLADVDVKLGQALSLAGYSDQNYFAIPNGYVLVTKLEQIDEHGNPLKAAARWQLNTATPCFSLVAYLKALLFATTGFFRVTAFAVTDQDFNPSGQTPTQNQALKWIGAPHLPAGASKIVFSKQHQVTALIYEFRKPENGDAQFLRPSELTAEQHLNAAGLLAALTPKK
jgi:hypothetical protein